MSDNVIVQFARSEVTQWDVGRSIRTLPPIAGGWRANRKQCLRVGRLPPKHPCIDWSGQLPDGRRDGSYPET